MRIGFDIDGVIAKQNTVNICLTKELPKIETIYYETREPMLNPYMFAADEDEIIFITGRKSELADITKRWCKKFFPSIKLVLAPSPQWKNASEKEFQLWFKLVAKHKAKIINKLKLDVYFEDMPETVKALRELCPNTKIIQYGGRIG